MAANFWTSSHQKQWLKTKEELEKNSNLKDKQQVQFSLEDIRRIKIHFVNEIQHLGRRLQLRQRVIASAIVYMRRFYSKCNFVDFCPRLVAPTCLYISTKVEECSTQSPAYRIAGEMKKHDPNWPYTTNHILEYEFFVLETLQFFLIVYHPYRSLVEYLTDCKMEKGSLDVAWSLVNDSYCTELSLIFPPYIIALAAIYIASATCEIDLRLWFSELCVDMKEIWMASNELLEFYESVKREKASPPVPTATLLSRLPSRHPAISNQSAPSTHPPNFVPSSKQTGRPY